MNYTPGIFILPCSVRAELSQDAERFDLLRGVILRERTVCINDVEGFWSFAKERLIKHHGISKNKFLLYIKEMEWRYNNRDYNLFDLLVKYMLGADN